MTETLTVSSSHCDIDVTKYALGAEEAEQVLQLSRRACAEYEDPHCDETVSKMAALAGDLPLNVRSFIHGARLAERPPCLILVRNITITGELGRTPESWHAADTADSRQYAFTALLLGSLLGDPIGWSAQQLGRIVTDVLPARGMEQTDVSSSSARELSWHTEDGFSPYRADWVGLLCLRNPARVATTLARVNAAEIPDHIDRVLREPRFFLPPDPAHDLDADVEAHRDPVAILTGAPDAPNLRADRDFMRPAPGDVEAGAALEWLIDHLDGRLADIVLASGDMAFINNNVLVHGRRAFQATYSSTERWLKRINIVRDIHRTRPGRSVENRRVIRSS